MHQYTCAFCNKDFKHRNKNRKFCSNKCSNFYKWKISKNIGLPKRGIVKICLWCNSEFYTMPSGINKRNYCCQSCVAKHRYHFKKDIKLKTFPKQKDRKKKYYKNSGGICEHRIIAQEKIGRKIMSNEEVHHIDFNPHNNDIDNLVVMKKSEHRRLHALKRLNTPLSE